MKSLSNVDQVFRHSDVSQHVVSRNEACPHLCPAQKVVEIGGHELDRLLVLLIEQREASIHISIRDMVLDHSMVISLLEIDQREKGEVCFTFVLLRVCCIDHSVQLRAKLMQTCFRSAGEFID